jgi:hypothetical protein
MSAADHATARPEREAVIVGYGFEYLVMALNCARSIRASNPGLATVLVTNIAVDPASVADRFDRVVVRDEPADRNRLVKTSILEYTTASKVLYVDADSEVVGDLDPAFRLLDRFDVVLRMMAIPVNKPFELAPGVPGGVFPHLHGGMFLLRDDAPARGFLANWQRRMLESGLSRDQPALARTVYDLPELRLVVLNAIWSADEFEVETLFHPTKHEPPRIRHYARPHTDLAVARRLRDTLEGLLPLLPVAVRDDSELAADIVRVREKYRRLTHPLFASPLTRRVYLSAAHRWGRWRRGIEVDIRDRRAIAAGRAYTRDAGQLWED